MFGQEESAILALIHVRVKYLVHKVFINKDGVEIKEDNSLCMLGNYDHESQRENPLTILHNAPEAR